MQFYPINIFDKPQNSPCLDMPMQLPVAWIHYFANVVLIGKP